MKIEELLEKLQKLPKNFDVYTEGCDCWGDVNEIEVGTRAICLKRSPENSGGVCVGTF